MPQTSSNKTQMLPFPTESVLCGLQSWLAWV